MTNAEKLAKLEILLGEGGTLPDEQMLQTYLDLAGEEILNWKFHLVGGTPKDLALPKELEVTQIYAVIAGYTHAGAEGQSVQIENGVHRHFNYDDMLGYIHEKVLPYVRVGAVRRL